MNKRLLSAVWLGIALGSAPTVLSAKNLAVQLDSIQRFERQEERGDELYFNITEYSNMTAPRFYQVPRFPTHWLSQYLEKVQNVTLWEKNLQDGESVQIIFSLVERDAPPWNVDDLIGSVKLNLRLERNELKREWRIPNKEITSPVEGKNTSYYFEGDDGKYRVKFRLKPIPE